MAAASTPLVVTTTMLALTLQSRVLLLLLTLLLTLLTLLPTAEWRARCASPVSQQTCSAGTIWKQGLVLLLCLLLLRLLLPGLLLLSLCVLPSQTRPTTARQRPVDCVGTCAKVCVSVAPRIRACRVFHDS